MNAADELNKYQPKAKRILDDDSKIQALIDAVGEKITELIANNDQLKEFVQKIQLILRMIKAYMNKTYQEIPWKTTLSLVGGLIYFVTPLDFIPDFIPVLGMVDDITIILWLFKSFHEDIEKYEAWENENTEA